MFGSWLRFLASQLWQEFALEKLWPPSTNQTISVITVVASMRLHLVDGNRTKHRLILPMHTTKSQISSFDICFTFSVPKAC